LPMRFASLGRARFLPARAATGAGSTRRTGFASIALCTTPASTDATTRLASHARRWDVPAGTCPRLRAPTGRAAPGPPAPRHRRGPPPGSARPGAGRPPSVSATLPRGFQTLGEAQGRAIPRAAISFGSVPIGRHSPGEWSPMGGDWRGAIDDGHPLREKLSSENCGLQGTMSVSFGK